MRRARPESYAFVLCTAVLARSATAQPTPMASEIDDPAAASAETQVPPPSAAAASSTAAAGHRVVLLDPPEHLERALRTALLPWGIQVEGVIRAKPGATLPGTALQAGVLARELNAEALVWLSANADGAALWIYETSRDAIRARAFPDRPIDEALAAALALSVKTWLRTSDLQPEPAAEGKERAVADEVVPVASARNPAAAPARRDTSSPVLQSHTARTQVLIHVAARRGALEPGVFDLRYGVEVRASAWRSHTHATQLWFGARLDTGEPHEVSSSTFRGVYSELGGGVSLGISQRIAPAFGLNLHAGATLHRASVSGTLLADGSAAEQARWGASAQVRPEMELILGPLGVVVQPTLGGFPGQRVYLADGLEVLKTSTLWWALGGALRLDVF